MADEGIGIQSVEDFWGVELSSKKKKVSWPSDPDDEVEDDLEKTLELRQACLGAKAKEGERNVVQLTAEDEEGQDVTHTILSMRVGGAEQTQLFLTLQPPVTFELVSGNGPVHIIGTLNQTLLPLLTDDESSEEEEEERNKKALISPEVKGKTAPSKKRPAPSPAQKPAKVPKLAAKEEDSEEDSDEEDSELDEEDSDEEDSEGEDMDTELAAALREAQAAKSKAKQVMGVRTEDSDESEEEDESDEEDEDEEESDESEDEQPPAKKPQVNGKPKSKQAKPASKTEKGKQQAKTPQPIKPSSKTVAPKGSQSAPTTPKTIGGGEKAKKSAAKV